MDPVAQTFAQQSSGSAGGATLGLDALQFALKSRASNQIAREQLDLQRSTAEIQRSQQRLALRVNQMRLEQMNMLNEAGASLAELELGMARDPSGFLSGGGLDKARSIFNSHPDLYGTDAGQGFINRMAAAAAGSAKLDRIKEAIDAASKGGMAPSSVTINPSGGVTQTFRAPSPTGSEFAPTVTMKNLEALGKARLTGDEDAVKALEIQLGLGKLDPVVRFQYEAELRSIYNDPYGMRSDTQKEEAHKRLNEKYGLEVQGGSTSQGDLFHYVPGQGLVRGPLQ